MAEHLISGKDALDAIPDFKLIGRDSELKNLSALMVRKYSNSVILVAPSGVGASALCLGLQALKDAPNAPFDVVSKTLYWLDVDSMFTCGNPQQIDEAFQKVMTRMRRSMEPVLIIEDAGDFIDACRSHNASHFINSINALVKQNKLQVILETSDQDASKVLSWHSDLRESYTIMDLTEPTGENLTAIVTASATKLKEHHGVDILPDAIETAIELTQKYRQSGSASAQPKRSIELLDQSLASYRLAAHVEPPSVQRLKKQKTQTQETLTQIDALMSRHLDNQAKLKKYHASQREAEQTIAQLEDALLEENNKAPEEAPAQPSAPALSFQSLTTARQGSTKAQELRSKLNQFRTALVEHKSSYAQVVTEMNKELALDRDTVVAEFSNLSGIPVAKLGEDEKEILRELEANLKNSVFGQDPGVEKISNAIKVSRVGRRNKNKPQAAFLLAGPSGVGKTEVAKQIALQLLGDEKALTRFDMSEYMERHAVSKLIGAPPGYEGFDAGGILTNAIRQNRNRVILFDEIEKAHPDVFNLFLQILDDGRLTDNIGRLAEFSDCIIIMTTNIGQPHFLDKALTHKQAMQGCMEDLETTYRPEFLNRFNGRENIVGFQRLELPSIERIIQREVNDLTNSYKTQDVFITFPLEHISAFCADRYDPKIGARGLPGAIITELEPRVVDVLLDVNDAGAQFDVSYNVKTRLFDVSMTRQAA